MTFFFLLRWNPSEEGDGFCKFTHQLQRPSKQAWQISHLGVPYVHAVEIFLALEGLLLSTINRDGPISLISIPWVNFFL
jgi:hypothetical protein